MIRRALDRLFMHRFDDGLGYFVVAPRADCLFYAIKYRPIGGTDADEVVVHVSRVSLQELEWGNLRRYIEESLSTDEAKRAWRSFGPSILRLAISMARLPVRSELAESPLPALGESPRDPSPDFVKPLAPVNPNLPIYRA